MSTLLILALLAVVPDIDEIATISSFEDNMVFSGHPEHIHADEYGIYLRIGTKETRGNALAVLELDGTPRFSPIVVESPFWIANFASMIEPETGDPMIALVSLGVENKKLFKRTFFYSLIDGSKIGVAYDADLDNPKGVYFRQVFDQGEFLLANTWEDATGHQSAKAELRKFVLQPISSDEAAFLTDEPEAGFLIRYIDQPFYSRFLDKDKVETWRRLVYPALLDGQLIVGDQLGRRLNHFDDSMRKKGWDHIKLPMSGEAAFVDVRIPENFQTLTKQEQLYVLQSFSQMRGLYSIGDRLLVTWQNPDNKLSSIQGKRPDRSPIHFVQIIDERGRALGRPVPLGHAMVGGFAGNEIILYERVGEAEHRLSRMALSSME